MKLLFICTHNRCRSILAEAISNHLANGKIIARSAGSSPAGEVHPLSIQFLQEKGIATDHCQSQSWNDFADFEPDAVITLCDSAAKEACPVWFGNAAQVHWGLRDPSKNSDGVEDAEIRRRFFHTMDVLSNRITAILDFASILPKSNQITQTLDQLKVQFPD